MRLPTLIALVIVLLLPAGDAAAQQGLFAPRLLIDGKAITNYEYDQRLRFMQLLGAPGDLREEAEKTLIEDRLRMIAAERLKLRATEAQIRAGMEEFAARGGLSVEEFVTLLGQAGVAPETFRDFVQAGLLWREVVRTRFAAFATGVTEAEIDRALSIPAQRGVVRVLLSEIVLPGDAEELAEELAGLRGEAAFAAAARRHSTAASAAQGGRLDWIPAGNLPPAVLANLQGLPQGGVTTPLRDGRDIVLYLLRNVDQRDEVTAQITAIEYAQFLIPGAGTPAAQAEAERIRARVDVCGDLYGVARGLPEERLTITSQPLTAVPAALAGTLATLDPGESALVPQGEWLNFLMLCSRTVQTGAEVDREAVRERLINERLAGHAEIYLQELRANAHIRRP